MFMPMANKISHHEKEWWEDTKHPERAFFLAQAVNEPADDSEDDMGLPLYKESKCQLYRTYLSDCQEKVDKNEKTRERIKTKN